MCTSQYLMTPAGLTGAYLLGQQGQIPLTDSSVWSYAFEPTTHEII